MFVALPWMARLARVLLFICLGLTCEAVFADVQYIHDAAGRLSQVIAADGSSALYEYDATGNIVAIHRLTADQLAIGSFSPVLGGPGTQVVIRGSGFSSTASANTVRFNGSPATVSSSTANQLVAQVPNGATSGPISVTVAAGTVTSSQSFLIQAGPTITGFSPTMVDVGATVTVTGTDLNPVVGATWVKVGQADVQGASISATQLTFVAKSSGAISVSTPYGQAVSSTDLLVIPTSIGSANVIASTPLTGNGGAQSLAISQPSKYGLFSFDATQGQFLSVQLTSMTTTPAGASVAYQVVSPAGVVIASGTLSPSNASIHLPQIALTGTYLVAFASGSSTVQMAAALEINSTLSGGVPISGATSLAGQSRRFVLVGAPGQTWGLGLTNIAGIGTTGTVAASVQVNNPDGSSLFSGSSSCNSNPPPQCSFQLPSMSASGAYTVTVSSASHFSFTLAVSLPVTAALTAGTPYNLTLSTAGQFAQLKFTATAGQTLALNVASLVTSPANLNLSIAVNDPAGVQVTTANGNTTLNLTNTVAGTYTITLIPQWAATVTAQLTLFGGVTATVATDGTPTSVATNVVGQSAYLTFSGTAGQILGMGIENVAGIGSSGTVSVGLQVNRPDGSSLYSSGCNSNPPPQCSYQLPTLPVTGTYTVIVTSSARISFTLTVAAPVTGVLSLGTAYNLNVPIPGQFAQLSFTTTAGQTLALSVASVVTSPANLNLSISVIDPTGAVALTGNGNTTLNLRNTVAGTYTVTFIPQWAATVTAQLNLIAGVSSSVATDGTATSVSTNIAGQSAYLTFAGTAGQILGMGIENIAGIGSSGTVSVGLQVNRPDGSSLYSSGCNSNPPPQCSYQLPTLPVTGTYTVIVTSSARISFTLTISPPVTGTLTAGTTYNLSVPIAGQFAQLGFAASAGQSLTLNVSSVVTSPANLSLSIAVTSPSGAQVATGSTTTSTSLSLTNLSSGNYTVTLIPQWAATVTSQVLLH